VSAASRRRLWAVSSALADAGAEPDLSDRTRRFARRDWPAVSLEDLQAAPDWVVESAERRARLATLAGAAACARAWRVNIEGSVLRRAAEAIGEPALDALLNTPASLTPAVADVQAEAGDLRALQRLGGRALMAEAAGRPGLARRLSALLPDAPSPLTDAAAGATLAQTACALAVQVEAAP